MDDSISKQSCITAISPALLSAKILHNVKATIKKIQGVCVAHADDAPVHTSSQVSATLTEARKQGGEMKIKFCT